MKSFFLFLGLLCAMLAGTPEAQAAKRIKIAYTNFPEHPQGVAFAMFKKELEARSNGAFKVDLIDSGKYGNPDSIVKGLQMNVLQIGAESTSNFSVFDPRLMLFDIPYLFPSYEAADLVLDGPVGKELGRGLEKNGCINLGYMEIGFRQIFSSRPVATLEEGRGLKIRVTPSRMHIAIIKALGMNPTPMAWGEVFTGLQQHTVEGIDVDINLGWFWRFYEVTSHVTLSRHFYTPHMVLISKRFLASLTPEEQQLIRDVMSECIREQRKLSRQNEQVFLEKFQSEWGMTIHDLSAGERKRWMEATSKVPDEFKDAVPPALLEQVRETFRQAGMDQKS